MSSPYSCDPFAAGNEYEKAYQDTYCSFYDMWGTYVWMAIAALAILTLLLLLRRARRRNKFQ